MSKIVVTITRSIMLIEPHEGVVIDRPRLVVNESFVRERLACGELKSWPDYAFPDAAKDKDFQDWLTASQGDIPLATASFYSSFPGLPPVDSDTYRAVSEKAEKAAKAAAKAAKEQKDKEDAAARRAATAAAGGQK